MGVDKGDVSAPVANGLSETQLRAMVHAVAEAIDRLIAALDAAGLNQQLRESSAAQLGSLDRSLPTYTIGELLLVCEAYATVTAPAALAIGDYARVRDEARRVLHLVQALAGAIRGRPKTRETAALATQSAALRAALSKPQVRTVIAELMDSLSTLAVIEAGVPGKRRRLLPINMGCVVPGTVLGGALTLIIMLITSMVLATGQVSISPKGLGLISGQQAGSATPTTSAHMSKPSPTAARQPEATATRAPNPTATMTPSPISPSSTPMVSVSKSTVSPCPAKPDTFTISYFGGQQPITWSASWSDPANVTLNPTNGTLSTGSYVNVTVTVQGDSTGTITITPSNNLPIQTLNYDSTNC